MLKNYDNKFVISVLSVLHFAWPGQFMLCSHALIYWFWSERLCYRTNPGDCFWRDSFLLAIKKDKVCAKIRFVWFVTLQEISLSHWKIQISENLSLPWNCYKRKLKRKLSKFFHKKFELFLKTYIINIVFQ